VAGSKAWVCRLLLLKIEHLQIPRREWQALGNRRIGRQICSHILLNSNPGKWLFDMFCMPSRELICFLSTFSMVVKRLPHWMLLLTLLTMAWCMFHLGLPTRPCSTTQKWLEAQHMVQAQSVSTMSLYIGVLYDHIDAWILIYGLGFFFPKWHS
jgi:hypothetical protein